MKSKFHTPSYHPLPLPRLSFTPESFSSSPCTVNGGYYQFITLYLCCSFLVGFLDFTAEQISYEHCFGQFGSAVLAMNPPSLLPIPPPPWFLWARGDVGEAALMWEYCSAVAKTLMSYQHLSRHKEQCYDRCYGEI